jgi:hypothetical protein
MLAGERTELILKDSTVVICDAGTSMLPVGQGHEAAKDQEGCAGMADADAGTLYGRG